MKSSLKMIVAAMAVVAGISLATACSDANEYKDSNTDNPSWIDGYNDSISIAHPASLANTTYVRGLGMKKNAYGQEVQGFIESLTFVTEDSVIVRMSQGATEGTWVDDSNTETIPLYEYTYSDKTGSIEIKKESKDSKGNLTKTSIIVGVAVSGKQEGITVVHYGDTPSHTYLVKQ